MNIRFRPLFTVAITHAYHGGRCRSFRFLTPGDTRSTLEASRTLARERDGVLHVLHAVDEDGDPFARISGRRLRFGLRLTDSHFGNYTELPAGFPTRRLRHTNASDPGLLAPEGSPVLVGPRFTHVPTDPARPVTLTLRNAEGEVLGAETLESGELSLSFDLRDRPNGAFTLEEAFPGDSNTVLYYLDGELKQRDAVGLVEVEVDDAFYSNPPTLEITFTATEEVLRYYLVARNYSTSDLNKLSVSDKGFGEEGRAEIEFDRISPSAFGTAELDPALISRPGESVVLFRSRTALARQERGRRRIQLSRQNDVLIPNLPQPGAKRATADIIVHVSKP